MKKFFNTKIKNQNNRAFTLIELLVVVAIIGILSSVVLASLNSAREKARDSQRLSDIKQIQNALEMYFNDYGFYPKRQAHTETDQGCGGTDGWCASTNSLRVDLGPYLKNLPLALDSGFKKLFYYDSDFGDNYQTYGLGVVLDDSKNAAKEESDGGYYSSMYEIGQQPSYCVGKYSGTDSNWWLGLSNVCGGGN